ncbi:MAG: peptidase, partial [Bacteroidota bacterium]
PQVTQIGDATSGDFSDTSMDRFLPNGWIYQYSIMRFLLPDGTSLDGTGHVPDIFIRNTVEDITADRDRVLERAFTFLFEAYGIE